MEDLEDCLARDLSPFLTEFLCKRLASLFSAKAIELNLGDDILNNLISLFGRLARSRSISEMSIS